MISSISHFPSVVALHCPTVRCVLVIAQGNFRLEWLYVHSPWLLSLWIEVIVPHQVTRSTTQHGASSIADPGHHWRSSARRPWLPRQMSGRPPVRLKVKGKVNLSPAKRWMSCFPMNRYPLILLTWHSSGFDGNLWHNSCSHVTTTRRRPPLLLRHTLRKQDHRTWENVSIYAAMSNNMLLTTLEIKQAAVWYCCGIVLRFKIKNSIHDRI